MHFNCGLETLAATLLSEKDSMSEVDFVQVLKVDLKLVSEWLYSDDHFATGPERASLERLALDLEHPN